MATLSDLIPGGVIIPHQKLMGLENTAHNTPATDTPKTWKELAEGGYKFLESLQNEQLQKEQMRAIQYIEKMAALLSIDIKDCDIYKVFKDEDSIYPTVITDRRKINNLLHEYGEKLALNLDEELSVLSDEWVKEVEQERKYWVTSQIQARERTIWDYTRKAKDCAYEVNNALAQVNRLRTEIAQLRGDSPLKLVEELQKIARDGFWRLHSANTEVVSFTTRNEIVLTYHNEAAGLHMHVPMGRYLVNYHIKANRLEVKPHEKNLFVGEYGYYHPYISESGYICWGNASDTAIKLISELKLHPVFKLLASLLSNYNVDTNPYRALEDFQDVYNKGGVSGVARGTTDSTICDACDEPLDHCECYTCDICDWRDPEIHCDRHWCAICETDNYPDCGCCHQCENSLDYCDCCPDCGHTDDDCDRCRECGHHDGGHSEDCSENQENEGEPPVLWPRGVVPSDSN